MCCFDKMLLSAAVRCIQQEMLECSFFSVSSVGFNVQLSKWLNLHLALEPVVFGKCIEPLLNMPGQRSAVRENDTWILNLGAEEGGMCVSNFVCLKVILKYLYHEIQSWSHDCLLKRKVLLSSFVVVQVSVLLLEKKIVKYSGFLSEKLHDLLHKREKMFCCLAVSFHGG